MKTRDMNQWIDEFISDPHRATKVERERQIALTELADEPAKEQGDDDTVDRS